MTAPKTDPLAAVSWRTCGRVSIDGATVVLGDLAAFLFWQTTGERTPNDEVLDGKLAFFGTGGDWDCPVEKGFLGADVVAVRVEFYKDVADVEGSWDAVGELSLDSPCCVAVGPTRTLPAQADRLVVHPPAEDTDLRADSGIIVGAVLRVPVGRYRVEAFHSRDYETMGLRLRLLRA